MGRDMMSRFSPTVYHGMDGIVSGKGRNETLVVAENVFFVSENVSHLSHLGYRSSYGNDGVFIETHQCH